MPAVFARRHLPARRGELASAERVRSAAGRRPGRGASALRPGAPVAKNGETLEITVDDQLTPHPPARCIASSS